MSKITSIDRFNITEADGELNSIRVVESSIVQINKTFSIDGSYEIEINRELIFQQFY